MKCTESPARKSCKEHEEQGGTILDQLDIKIGGGGVGVDSSPKFHLLLV